MRKGFSEIVAVLDRSGSMGNIVDDAIGGFNTFLKGQKEADGDANLTLVLFDSEYLTPYKNKPLGKVDELDRSTFVPRGMTGLYDAVGKAIVDTKEHISTLSEDDKPEQVIVAILTDGGENASREFNRDTVKKMIEEAQADDWGFVFLAANQDAALSAENIGISGQYAMNFSQSTRGMAKSFDAMNQTVCSYRSGVDKSTLYAASMTKMTDELDDQGSE